MTTTALPATQEELEDAIHDPARMRAVWDGGPDAWASFCSDYAKATLAANKGQLAREMAEGLQSGAQEFLQGQPVPAGFKPGAGLSGLQGRGPRAAQAIRNSARSDAAYQVDKQALYNPAAMGAALDGEDYGESMGRFLYSTHKAEKDAAKRGDTAEVTRVQEFKQKVASSISNAMSERIPSEGGFLLPENLRSDVLMIALEEAIIRPRARVVPMDSLRVPLPAVDDVSHQSSVYGGVIGYWTEEGAALTASAPSWSRVVLEARKLTAYTAMPAELLQDSITPLDQWFSTFFPKAIAWFEDVAFITGTGVGEPQGILNAPGAVSMNSGSATHLYFSDVAAMYTRMWPASINRAVWLCSPDTLNALIQLTLSSSQAIAPPLMLQGYQALGHPAGGNGDGVNYTLMGRPLIVSEKMPSILTNTAGCLTFVDLDYYLLGDRQTMQVASSDEYLFGQDMIAYRVIERLDGRFWLQSAITPENGSTNTLSPLVTINVQQ